MLYNFVVFVVCMAGAVVALLVMSIAVAPRSPHPVKDDTYECGLPAVEPVVSKVNFQYYFYAIVFIAVDIAGAMFALYAVGASNALFAVFPLLVALPVFYVTSERGKPWC